MVAVIIAGGSGTRLWPLSTPDYPKHLLQINGSQQSLLQATYARAAKLSTRVYVASETSHIDAVRQQLPNLADDQFIVEPGRRGTANCIMEALAYLKHSVDPHEPIAFLAADHYIRDIDGFVHSFKLAADTAQRTGRIVLLGAEPDHPATGFGYIEKGELVDEANFVFAVKSFKEKPAFATAKAYLKSGNYLWNCGYFVGTNQAFEAAMEQYAPELLHNYEQLLQASPDEYKQVYLSLEPNSIDYALIEKVPDLLAVPTSFDWMDMGSYHDLHKAVMSDEQGNHVQGNVAVEEVQNSFIQNHEDKPVAVIGLDNVVVVNTPQGIVVARKDVSQKIGEVSKRLQA